MKNPNQIRRNSRGAARAVQPKVSTPVQRPVRPIPRVPLLRDADRNLLEEQAEKPAHERGWNEVAMIDFAGYTDRDCEERIIYKMPDGKLKAARRSTGEAEVIEDVTREQVTRWIAQCVIPEEFQTDFAPQRVPRTSGTLEVKQLASQLDEREERAAFSQGSSTTQPNELAKITANILVDHAFSQRNAEDSVSSLAGLRELLLPHAGFRELCHAIEGIDRGFNFLITFNREVHSI